MAFRRHFRRVGLNWIRGTGQIIDGDEWIKHTALTELTDKDIDRRRASIFATGTAHLAAIHFFRVLCDARHTDTLLPQLFRQSHPAQPAAHPATLAPTRVACMRFAPPHASQTTRARAASRCGGVCWTAQRIGSRIQTTALAPPPSSALHVIASPPLARVVPVCGGGAPPSLSSSLAPRSTRVD